MFFALALAAAVLDVTLGLRGPARGLAAWLRIVRGAAGGPLGVALYFAPVGVAAAAVAQALPAGALGFAATALLISMLCGRQDIDRRATELARLWEAEGPYGAGAAAEALGAPEGPPADAGAAAIAARFADSVAAQTLFIVIGGLVGAALGAALALASRECRDGGDPFARAVSRLADWSLAPAARLGALLLALAAAPAHGPRLMRLAVGRAARPTAPAEAVMLAALGASPRDAPDHMRRALALYRRAAAVEFGALATLTVAAALAG